MARSAANRSAGPSTSSRRPSSFRHSRPPAQRAETPTPRRRRSSSGPRPEGAACSPPRGARHAHKRKPHRRRRAAAVAAHRASQPRHRARPDRRPSRSSPSRSAIESWSTMYSPPSWICSERGVRWTLQWPACIARLAAAASRIAGDLDSARRWLDDAEEHGRASEPLMPKEPVLPSSGPVFSQRRAMLPQPWATRTQQQSLPRTRAACFLFSPARWPNSATCSDPHRRRP